MSLHGYDAWKLATPPEYDEPDPCVRDDSTECGCARCVAAEDRFWDEQGEQVDKNDGAPAPSCANCGFTSEGCSQLLGCDFGEVPR